MSEEPYDEDPLSEEYLRKNAERCVREAMTYLVGLYHVVDSMLKQYSAGNAPASEMFEKIKKAEYYCDRVKDKLGCALDYENVRVDVEKEGRKEG